MRSINQPKIRKASLLVMLLLPVLAQACNAPLTTGDEPQPTASPTDSDIPLQYMNAEYGFRIYLPDSWVGYAVTTTSWDGFTQDEQLGDVVTEQGPLITIVHPASTPEQPRQGIPIMVFTSKQWESLQRGEFWIGAAPIGPMELAQNGAYVFALPARYNYAFPEGWEEVEQILQGQPLQSFEPGTLP